MNRLRNDPNAPRPVCEASFRGTLESFGRVGLNRPIVSEPRAADVWFVPNADANGMETLGSLEQMAQTTCLLECGQVHAEAIAELVALPWNHPFKLHALERLAVLRINLELRQDLNRDEQELAMNFGLVCRASVNTLG
jgi:hypothetical protein